MWDDQIYVIQNHVYKKCVDWGSSSMYGSRPVSTQRVNGHSSQNPVCEKQSRLLLFKIYLALRTCLNSCFSLIHVSKGKIFYLDFLSLWQNAWHKQLKGGRIYLVHSFRGFSHRGGEGVAEQSSLHQSAWKAETDNACSRRHRPSPFVPSGPQSLKWCHSDSGWVLPA
jgi:hypothetical protein